jgi:GT2 family glycosyltransferase
MNDACKVAVVMRSLNEQPNTDRALAGLRRQTYRDWVLYNVDSGSTDGTFEAVQRFNPDPGKVFRIAREAYVPGPVLNMMIARTVEPIIVLLNADAVPVDERWLERLLAPLLRGEADAVMSRQIARQEASFVVKYDMDRGYDPRNIKGGIDDLFSAVACAFKRSLWEETKFRAHGYSEDLAWAKACRQKGARFELVPDSIVEHSHDFPLAGLYKKRWHDGVAFVDIFDEEPSLARQALRCGKEMARDLLHACAALRPDTIPYNLAYRATIHLAYYAGEREGARRRRLAG